MALVGSAITSAILAAGPSLTGTLWVELAKAVGTSVASWATKQSNVLVKGTVSGFAGGGSVLGKFTVIAAPGKVTQAFSAAGLSGSLAPQMATAIAVGVANALNASAQYKGTAAGAIGADVSSVSFTNAATLVAAIIRNLAAANITGTMGISFAKGCGNGIAAMLGNGNGAGTATGGAGPIPSSGTSISALV